MLALVAVYLFNPPMEGQAQNAARNLLPAAQMYLHAGNPGKRPLYEIGGPAYDARLDSFENPFEIHNK